MKTALLTGRTGFVRRNVLSILSRHFQMLAPTRAELDLKNLDSVRNYLLLQEAGGDYNPSGV